MTFDFQRFYRAVDARRGLRAVSWRQVAREAGVSASTLVRMAQDKRPSADGLALLAAWAGVNPADFVGETPPQNVQIRTDWKPSA